MRQFWLWWCSLPWGFWADVLVYIRIKLSRTIVKFQLLLHMVHDAERCAANEWWLEFGSQMNTANQKAAFGCGLIRAVLQPAPFIFCRPSLAKAERYLQVESSGLWKMWRKMLSFIILFVFIFPEGMYWEAFPRCSKYANRDRNDWSQPCQISFKVKKEQFIRPMTLAQ